MDGIQTNAAEKIDSIKKRALRALRQAESKALSNDVIQKIKSRYIDNLQELKDNIMTDPLVEKIRNRAIQAIQNNMDDVYDTAESNQYNRRRSPAKRRRSDNLPPETNNVYSEVKAIPGKLLMSGIGLFIGIIALKKVADFFKESAAQKRIDAVNAAILNETNKGKPLSYPVAYYNNFADSIEQATNGAGTDEASIYQVFGQMKNTTDVLQLEKAFGKRWNFDMFIPIGDLTLPKLMRSELTKSELSKLNKILADKKINIQF